MAELIIQSGKLKGKRLVLPAKEMVVGRDDDCDLRIASSLVSRKHCILKSSPEGILVVDLSSQNGTHVNDMPITEPTLLRDGDTLRIGATLLSVPSSPKQRVNVEGPQTKISEADIADWLAESGSKFSGPDTAVIGAYPPASSVPTPLPPTVAPPPSPTIAPTPKPTVAKTLSVKEEAALVIRKHWDAVKAKQKH